MTLLDPAQRLHDLTKARVDRLARRNRRRQIAGMAHHVGIGEGRYDQVIARLDGLR